MHEPEKIQCINDFKVTIANVSDPRYRLRSTPNSTDLGTVKFNTTHKLIQ
jgi:hypothetical protein